MEVLPLKKDILLRSMLYVPAYNKKFIDSALKCNADALIIDLEDSVPDEFKQVARINTKEYLDNGLFANKKIFIRLNPLESKMVFEDLKYVLHADVTGYQLSKIYTADEMFFCGTGAQVSPIGLVDGRKIGTGKMGEFTKKIQELYFKVVKNELKKYSKWCTEVK